MCIRIIREDAEIKYDSRTPLEKQLVNSQKVVINYDAKDKDIPKFVCEVERMCKTGLYANMEVEVEHSNHIWGAKAKKDLKKLMTGLEINEAVKLLVTLQSTADKKLEELSQFCLGKK